MDNKRGSWMHLLVMSGGLCLAGCSDGGAPVELIQAKVTYDISSTWVESTQQTHHIGNTASFENPDYTLKQGCHYMWFKYQTLGTNAGKWTDWEPAFGVCEDISSSTGFTWFIEIWCTNAGSRTKGKFTSIVSLYENPQYATNYYKQSNETGELSMPDTDLPNDNLDSPLDKCSDGKAKDKGDGFNPNIL